MGKEGRREGVLGGGAGKEEADVGGQERMYRGRGEGRCKRKGGIVGGDVLGERRERRRVIGRRERETIETVIKKRWVFFFPFFLSFVHTLSVSLFLNGLKLYLCSLYMTLLYIVPSRKIK